MRRDLEADITVSICCYIGDRILCCRNSVWGVGGEDGGDRWMD